MVKAGRTSKGGRAALAATLALLAGAFATSDRSSAIVGGDRAELSEYPYFAVVGNNVSRAGCGGALVAPDRVLTTAHCFSTVFAPQKPGVLNVKPKVRIGPDRIERDVRRYAIHPVNRREQRRAMKDSGTFAADLMVLELAEPVPEVEPLAVASMSAPETRAGTRAVTMGFGATDPKGRGGGRFKDANVTVNGDDVCSRFDKSRRYLRWTLCTRDPRLPGTDAKPPFNSACLGDSGGPLVTRTAQPLLIGVVSGGPACGTKRDPEFYALPDRDFAFAANPGWAPAGDGRPQVTGDPTTGSKLRCEPSWLVEPKKRVVYEWLRDGAFRSSSRRPVIEVTRRDEGERLRCRASGETQKGRGTTQFSLPVTPG